MSASTDQNTKLVKKLIFIVFGMFGFGFALVPIYDVFCEITGLNGKTAQEAASEEGAVLNKERVITVEFITHTSKDIPWEFRPETKKIKVHPGEVKNISFFAKNLSSKDIIGQAIPSVTPGTAALYFNKIECFCFNQQPLEAGNNILMPLTFYVDNDLPKEISTLTLSYTMYDVTETATVETLAYNSED